MAPMSAALRENEGKTPRGEDHRVLPVPPVHLGFSLRQVASGFHGRSRPPRRFPHPPSFSPAHPTVTLVRSFTHSLALSLFLSHSPSPPVPTSSPPLSHWKFPLHWWQASAAFTARFFFSRFPTATLFSQPVFLFSPLYRHLFLFPSLSVAPLSSPLMI